MEKYQDTKLRKGYKFHTNQDNYIDQVHQMKDQDEKILNTISDWKQFYFEQEKKDKYVNMKA